MPVDAPFGGIYDVREGKISRIRMWLDSNEALKAVGLGELSQQNVAFVVALQPGPDVDIARRFRDDDAFALLRSAAAELFHPDFECALPRFDSERTYIGLDGLRTLWLEWLAPWATYRTEIEEVIDCGDRVLLLFRDFGRREPGAEEVRGNVAAIWTVRDGKVARAEFYPSRDDALKAAGLEH